MFRDRIVPSLGTSSVIANKASFSRSFWWDTFHYNMGRNTKLIWDNCGINHKPLTLLHKLLKKYGGKERNENKYHVILLLVKLWWRISPPYKYLIKIKQWECGGIQKKHKKQSKKKKQIKCKQYWEPKKCKKKFFLITILSSNSKTSRTLPQSALIK